MTAAGPAGAQASEADIQQAVACLRAGGVVGLPTETVYGLAADAESATGVAAIYAIKGRPAGHPLIVHVPDVASACWWADLDERALRLARDFWPGPLTLIVPRRASVPAHACGEEATIGLRCPSHPVARRLLDAFVAAGGHGVAAPSANRFGRISPTRAAHVRDDLAQAVAIILDGGDAPIGLESTIVDLSRGRAVILRPGAVGAAELSASLGERVAPFDAAAGADAVPIGGSHAPRAAGTLAAHYAPATPMELVDAAAIDARAAHWIGRGARIGVWSRTRPQAEGLCWRAFACDARSAARELYAGLRELDAHGLDRLLVERPPADSDWLAVADRLQRAQTGSGR